MLGNPADMCRFLVNILPEDKRPAEVIAFTQNRLNSASAALDAHLQDRDRIAGPDVTVADLSCCGYFLYPKSSASTGPTGPRSTAYSTGSRPCRDWKHPYDLMPRQSLVGTVPQD